jgi:hypothetical protein
VSDVFHVAIDALRVLVRDPDPKIARAAIESIKLFGRALDVAGDGNNNAPDVAQNGGGDAR